MNFAKSTYTTLILLAHEKGQLQDADIQDKLKVFEGQVMEHVQSVGVSEAIHLLKEKAFRLRLALLGEMFSNDDFFRQIESTFVASSQEAVPADASGPLPQALQESLMVYDLITAPDEEEPHEALKEPMAEYGMVPDLGGVINAITSIANLKALMEAFGLNSSSMVAMLSSSLSFEVGLLIADMHQADTLSLDAAQQEELAGSLYKSIETFGVAASQQGIWELPAEDANQTITNIKIRAAIEDVKSGRFSRVARKDMERFLTA